jgi:DNA replication licensing factor MCM4
LKEIKDTEIYILNIDGSHLQSFDRQLYTALVNYPTEIIPIMDSVTTQVYLEIYSNYSEARPNVFLQVRITSLVTKSRIRDLNPSDIDKLISITGITIRNSDIVPEMKEAYFKCAVCSKVEVSMLQRSKITEPNECNNCKSKFSFDLVHNRSVYLDKQHVKLQETPEHMPEGETPLTVHLCCYDELVDFVKPGDRCEIVGIFRASGVRLNPNQRVTRSIYRTYIDVVSFTKQSKKRLNNEDKDEDLNGNDLNEEYKESLKQQVAEFAQNPDVYNILVDSFAPSIWENEDVKKGLLLQLFGGVSKDFRNSGRGRFRGDINILLVGDPSTAKSQLLQYVHNLAPRGIYTSGKVPT